MKDYMLFFSFLLIAMGSVSSKANTDKADLPTIEDAKKNKQAMTKVSKAYKDAKDKCIIKNAELKGKKLRDCIIETQKEVK